MKKKRELKHYDYDVIGQVKRKYAEDPNKVIGHIFLQGFIAFAAYWCISYFNSFELNDVTAILLLGSYIGTPIIMLSAFIAFFEIREDRAERMKVWKEKQKAEKN